MSVWVSGYAYDRWQLRQSPPVALATLSVYSSVSAVYCRGWMSQKWPPPTEPPNPPLDPASPFWTHVNIQPDSPPCLVVKFGGKRLWISRYLSFVFPDVPKRFSTTMTSSLCEFQFFYQITTSIILLIIVVYHLFVKFSVDYAPLIVLLTFWRSKKFWLILFRKKKLEPRTAISYI